MTVDEYKKDLAVLSVEEMYNKYIIAGDIWYFKEKYASGWHEQYDNFRLFISKKLDVHYNDVALAGSAKLGFSINPSKKYKKFNDDSDLDIIVISQKYFYMFWDAYRRDSYAEIRTPYFKQVCFSIFRKYMMLEGLSIKNDDFARWTKKTEGFEKDLQLNFAISNDIHYRIFESWDSAKDYYMSSIEKSKRNEEELSV